MSAINLNNSEEFVKELKIFNDGNAGIVEPVRVRIEVKTSLDSDDKKPNYKLIAQDINGAEINEGFYYHEPDAPGFTKYQAQRLILLARGVLGANVVFPVWNTPKEALDGVMHMVNGGLNRPFRVAVCYGTTKNPSQYLGFKSFGSFIQPITDPNTLSLTSSDCKVKTIPPKATEIVKPPKLTPAGNPNNLDWMQS